MGTNRSPFIKNGGGQATLSISEKNVNKGMGLDLSHLPLLKKISDVLLSKGLYVRSPYIPIPQNIDFVKKQSFLNGFFGDRRPLHAMEISMLHANIQFISGKKELLIGFSQVAKTKELKEFFVRGIGIIIKELDLYGEFLEDDDLSLAAPWVNDVSESKISPFSDKLMLFKITSLSAAKLRLFGDSLSVSNRHDLIAAYSRLVVETANYVEDGTNILIEHGWLEQMPLAANRSELAKV